MSRNAANASAMSNRDCHRRRGCTRRATRQGVPTGLRETPVPVSRIGRAPLHPPWSSGASNTLPAPMSTWRPVQAAVYDQMLCASSDHTVRSAGRRAMRRGCRGSGGGETEGDDGRSPNQRAIARREGVGAARRRAMTGVPPAHRLFRPYQHCIQDGSRPCRAHGVCHPAMLSPRRLIMPPGSYSRAPA